MADDDKKKDEINWKLEGMKLLVMSVTSAIGAVWAVRGLVDNLDRRVAIIESKVVRIETDIVPRSEHNAHWDALARTMDDLRQDVKDVRRTQNEIVQKVGK